MLALMSTHHSTPAPSVEIVIPVYNEAAAERHWGELVTLFDDTLT